MKDENGNNTKFWYCEYCTEEVEPENVTYEENHDRCGQPVEWIDLESRS